MTRKPILLIAFSNDYRSDGRYLRKLSTEQDEIRDALCSRAGQYEGRFISDLNHQRLAKELSSSDVRERLALFHFGGHAGGMGLVMAAANESVSGTDPVSLASLLGRQEMLGVVFLNACSTARQVDALLTAGVPAVIATNEAIEDDTATAFAAQFYRGLAEGLLLEEAFTSAQDLTVLAEGVSKSRLSSTRSFVPIASEQAGTPWVLRMTPASREKLKKWSPFARQEITTPVPRPWIEWGETGLILAALYRLGRCKSGESGSWVRVGTLKRVLQSDDSSKFCSALLECERQGFIEVVEELKVKRDVRLSGSGSEFVDSAGHGNSTIVKYLSDPADTIAGARTPICWPLYTIFMPTIGGFWSVLLFLFLWRYLDLEYSEHWLTYLVSFGIYQTLGTVYWTRTLPSLEKKKEEIATRAKLALKRAECEQRGTDGCEVGQEDLSAGRVS